MTTSVAAERSTYTVPEVAVVLGVSANHVRHLIRTGQLPGVIRLGRRVVVSREVLDGFAAGRTESPPTSPTGSAAGAETVPPRSSARTGGGRSSVDDQEAC